MDTLLFPGLQVSLLALLSGFVFGFLLQKGGVGSFDTIVSQLLLKDFTVMKIILTAIVVGGAGVYLLHSFGIIPTLLLSSTPLLYSALGGGIFGIGMSVTGYCPGTALVALMQGARDVIFSVFGMFVGAALYNQLSLYFLETTHIPLRLTIFGIHPSLLFLILGGVLLVIARFAPRRSFANSLR